MTKNANPCEIRSQVVGPGLAGVLADPTRKLLYEFVAGSRDVVGRDEAAAAVGIPRQTAAYHLDRLAEDGLVDVSFLRRTGRTGPGAGRPAKLYRRSDRDLEVTIPPRRYLVAARVFLEALRTGGSIGVAPAARRVGVSIGRSGSEAGLIEVLEDVGYVPATTGDGEIRFQNCPFHALAEQDREATCAMNLELVRGIIEGSGQAGSTRLAPEPGFCCVRISKGE